MGAFSYGTVVFNQRFWTMLRLWPCCHGHNWILQKFWTWYVGTFWRQSVVL